MLVAGGYSGTAILASAELYDPAAGTFTATGSMTSKRYDHTATLLPNGKVLIAGGDGGYDGYTILASADLYDPIAGTFTATGSMAAARCEHRATLLPSGKVLIAGGVFDGATPLASAELYDQAAGTFTATGSMTATRYDHTATLLPSGEVLIAGGRSDSADLTSAELYDPIAGTFTTTGNMAAARCDHTATLLDNGKVLVAGGQGYGILASAELYQ